MWTSDRRVSSHAFYHHRLRVQQHLCSAPHSPALLLFCHWVCGAEMPVASLIHRSRTITIGVAFLAYYLVQDNFETARFLKKEDKDTLRQILEHDRPNESTEFSWAEVRSAFKWPYMWLNGAQASRYHPEVSPVLIFVIQAIGVGLPVSLLSFLVEF